MVFRPCIDLHAGKVKQVVGGSFASGLRTNFEAGEPPAHYARLYRRDGLTGGHVVMLGPGNEAGAREALAAWPGGLQVGGGINAENAAAWLDAGASQVIVTSWVFPEGEFDPDRLERLVRAVGAARLVLDLSCRRRGDEYWVVTERWTRFTSVKVVRTTLEQLARSCAEFLIHAVDVEGLCRGIDENLVQRLAEWTPIPTTYAGGARSLDDLRTVTEIGGNRIDLTIGSALDIFGGAGVRYADAVEFNRRLRAGASRGE